MERHDHHGGPQAEYLGSDPMYRIPRWSSPRQKNKDTLRGLRQSGRQDGGGRGRFARYSVAEEDENSASPTGHGQQQTDALLEVKSGTADAQFLTRPWRKTRSARVPDFADPDHLRAYSAEDQYGIGFRKSGSDLCDKVNEIMATLNEDSRCSLWLKNTAFP